MEKEKKPIYKKWWFWVIAIVLILVVIISVGGNEDSNPTSSVSSNVNNIQELKLGETWTVEGQWKLTINSVKTTEERNQFSEKKPNQVIYVTYTYENIGYEDKMGLMEGLYFDLEPSGDSTVIDEKGEIAYSYPCNITTYPQETPVGAKCVNTQVCIGLNNQSDSITMNISKYDGNGKQCKAKYKLDIK